MDVWQPGAEHDQLGERGYAEQRGDGELDDFGRDGDWRLCADEHLRYESSGGIELHNQREVLTDGNGIAEWDAVDCG